MNELLMKKKRHDFWRKGKQKPSPPARTCLPGEVWTGPHSQILQNSAPFGSRNDFWMIPTYSAWFSRNHKKTLKQFNTHICIEDLDLTLDPNTLKDHNNKTKRKCFACSLTLANICATARVNFVFAGTVMNTWLPPWMKSEPLHRGSNMFHTICLMILIKRHLSPYWPIWAQVSLK